MIKEEGLDHCPWCETCQVDSTKQVLPEATQTKGHCFLKGYSRNLQCGDSMDLDTKALWSQIFTSFKNYMVPLSHRGDGRFQKKNRGDEWGGSNRGVHSPWDRPRVPEVSLGCFWNLLGLALLPLTALLESHWTTSGQGCSREYPVPDEPLLHHPEPNNWLSLSFVLTICPSGGFLWSAASQWLTDCLRSRYSSILITKLLPYPIGLGKVHMLTLLSARLSCHATWITMWCGGSM